MKLLINALLPTASTAFKRVNVLFNEKFVKFSTDELKVDDEVEIIDANGWIILPGGVDPHVHILGSASAAAADLESISKIALEGGWTSLAELSYHTENPIFSPADLKKAVALVNEHAWTSIALWGHVNIDEYPYHAESAQELWTKGVVGIALTAPAPNRAIPEISFTEIMDLFLDIYESDTAFAFQGFDHESHAEFSHLAQMEAIKKILRRMQENPIHIPRVSSFATIEFINSISKRSDISFALACSDLMALFASESFSLQHSCDFADTEEYRNQLFELLRTNKLYLISNSIAPKAKKTDYCELFIGDDPQLLGHSYLWVLSELWKKRKVPLATCIKMTSENASKRLGLYPQKGCLEAGSDADFLLYNPEAVTKLKNNAELTGTFEKIFIRGLQVAGKGFESVRNGGFLARTNSPKRRHNNTTWI